MYHFTVMIADRCCISEKTESKEVRRKYMGNFSQLSTTSERDEHYAVFVPLMPSYSEGLVNKS